MFENINFIIVAIVVGCAVVAFIIKILTNDTTIKLDNSMEKYVLDDDRERCLNDAAGVGDGSTLP